LNSKLGKIADGETLDAALITRRRALTVEGAAADLYAEQLVFKRPGLDSVRNGIERHLKPYFGAHARMDEITGEQIRSYMVHRLGEDAAIATIVRELSDFRRMFNLAKEQGKLRGAPAFKLPKPDNARIGFFEADEFAALVAALPVWFRGPVTMAYYTGWRMTSEIVTLEWRQIDLKFGTITLDPGKAKNKKGRMFPFKMFPALARRVFAEADAQRKALAKRGIITAKVFTRDGEPLHDQPSGSRKHGMLKQWVRAAWHAACEATSLGYWDGTGKKRTWTGKIPHDFRRTAVRNFVRANIPEKTIMKLVGLLTDEIFKRYHIVNANDLDVAVAQYAASFAIEAPPVEPEAPPVEPEAMARLG
jgi:integrase